MTRKDYELIADVIANLKVSEADQRHVAHAFAGALAGTNARFDRARFMEACDLTPLS